MNKEAFIAGFTKVAGSFDLDSLKLLPSTYSRTNNLPRKYESEITPELAAQMDEYLRRYEILSPQTNRVRQILPFGMKANKQNPYFVYQPNKIPGIIMPSFDQPYIRYATTNNTSIGNAIKAHELGHQIDFDQRPRWLLDANPDFIGPPPPKPSKIDREIAASVLARAIKGKDYTEDDHNMLAKALSSYTTPGLNRLLMPWTTKGLNEHLQTTNSFRGLQNYQELARKQLDEGWNTYTNIHPQTNYWQVNALKPQAQPQTANNFKNFKLSIPSTNDWQGPIAPPSVPTGGARPVSTDLNKQIPTPSPSYPTPKSPSIFDRLKGMMPKRQANTTPNNIK